MQITPNDFTTIVNVVSTNASAVIKVNLPDYPNYATILVPGPFLSS
jgi:hypothetical protein